MHKTEKLKERKRLKKYLEDEWSMRDNFNIFGTIFSFLSLELGFISVQFKILRRRFIKRQCRLLW